jgi:hypothetical protein
VVETTETMSDDGTQVGTSVVGTMTVYGDPGMVTTTTVDGITEVGTATTVGDGPHECGNVTVDGRTTGVVGMVVGTVIMVTTTVDGTEVGTDQVGMTTPVELGIVITTTVVGMNWLGTTTSVGDGPHECGKVTVVGRTYGVVGIGVVE